MRVETQNFASLQYAFLQMRLYTDFLFLQPQSIRHESEPLDVSRHLLHRLAHNAFCGVARECGDGVEEPKFKDETVHKIDVLGVAGDHTGVSVLLEGEDFGLLHPERTARAKMHVAVEEKFLVLVAEGLEVEVDSVGKFYRALRAVKTQIDHIVCGVRIVVEVVDVICKVLRCSHLTECKRNVDGVFQKFEQRLRRRLLLQVLYRLVPFGLQTKNSVHPCINNCLFSQRKDIKFQIFSLIFANIQVILLLNAYFTLILQPKLGYCRLF